MADDDQKPKCTNQIQYKPPRIELTFPEFDIENLRPWIRKCNSFFNLCQVPHHLKMDYVSMHIGKGKADYWYESYVSDHVGSVLDWDKFCVDICRRFDVNFDPVDVLDKLKNLEHTGDVEEYMEKFEEIRSHMVHCFADLPESYCVSLFIAGLKPEIKYSVLMHKPVSLMDAFRVAKLQERSNAAFYKRMTDEQVEEQVVTEQEEGHY